MAQTWRLRGLRGRAAMLSASPCCRATALAAASRSVLPVLASWQSRVLVETRFGAVAIFFSHSGLVFFFLGLALALGSGGLSRSACFFRQSGRAQRSRSVSDRDVGRRDIGHRLDAFGTWAALRFSLISFISAGGFRFVIHRMPHNFHGAHRQSMASGHPIMHRFATGASLGRGAAKTGPVLGRNQPSWSMSCWSCARPVRARPRPASPVRTSRRPSPCRSGPAADRR